MRGQQLDPWELDGRAARVTAAVSSDSRSPFHFLLLLLSLQLAFPSLLPVCWRIQGLDGCLRFTEEPSSKAPGSIRVENEQEEEEEGRQ